MQKTKIPYVDYSWNPSSGCSRACSYCYASRMAHRFRRSFEPTCHPERLDDPMRLRKPSRIFIDSSGDLFDPAIPPAFIAQVLNTIGSSPWHTYLILTKQARRMAEVMGGFYSAQLGFTEPTFQPLRDVWLGVTAESQREADERIPLLLQTPAAVHWLSLEPLLGPVDLGAACPCGYYCDPDGDWDYPYGHHDHSFITPGRRADINWIVVGNDSSPGAKMPDAAWVESIVLQCRDADVPIWIKGELHDTWPITMLPGNQWASGGRHSSDPRAAGISEKEPSNGRD